MSENPDPLLSILQELKAYVKGLEPERYAGNDVAIVLKRLAEAEKLCGAAKLLMARRAHDINTAGTDGATDPSQFVASECGLPVGRSRRDLDTARRIQEQPVLEAALREGALSPDQAALIAPAIEADPKAATRLLDTAREGSFRDLKGECDAVIAASMSELELVDREARLRERRYLHVGTTDAGSVYLKGELPPVEGALVKNALESMARQVFNDARPLGIRERHDAYMADALVRLCRTTEAGPAIVRNGAPGSDSRATDEARRAPRAEIVLHVSAEALRRGEIQEGERCEIEGVGPVCLSTVEYLFGAAWTKLIVERGVDVVSVTHLGRNIPAHIDSALRARDRVCAVPGCGISWGLERDHIVGIEEGGPTELDNLVRLCKRHHYLKTHKFWRLIGRPGSWEWVNVRLEQETVAPGDECDVAPPLEPTAGLARPLVPLPPLGVSGPEPAHGTESDPDTWRSDDAADATATDKPASGPKVYEQRLFA